MNDTGRPTATRGESKARWAASLALVCVCVLVVLAASADRPRRSPSVQLALPGPPEPATVDGATRPPEWADGALDSASPNSPPDAGAATGPDAATAGYGCRIADEGFGAYLPWSPLPVGRVLIPDPPPRGSYDLVVHFHGAEAARKLLAPAGLGVVLAALDAGEGSASYEEAFYGPGVLEGLLVTIDAAVRSRSTDARLGHVIISSWSAGYGAVRQILLDEPWRPDAFVLLDSLHASYEPGASDMGALGEQSLEPFIELARRANDSDGELWLTHSDIRPPGYASTTETASLLLTKLGGQRHYAGLEPVAGIVHKTRYDHGGLHIWGFSGTTRDAHCSQLRLLLPLLRDHVLPALSAAPSR